MTGVLDKVYRELPVWGQNAMVSIYGLYWHWLRFGQGFNSFAGEFASRERLSAEDWKEWQKTQLRQMLIHAVNHVPYYRKMYSSDQKRAALNGDLGGLPLLEKAPLREYPRRFVRDDIHEKDMAFYTSGTTGTPISTIWSIPENRQSLALREIRSANWAGVSFKIPRATFSGRMVEPNPDSKGPFHRYNAVERQVYFSAFHLKPENAKRYVQALWDHKVEWMTGYAVSYYLLARFILDQELEVPPLKAIITTSEKVTPEMRSVMETAYGCKVFEEYSTVENAIFASECEHGNLHVSPDVAVVEILRPDGTACAAGEVGEVVVTGLLRYHQPLIRFRLGDLAAWNNTSCQCGREMPILKEVVGRIEDLVVGPDGRQMVRFHGIFVDQPHIIEGQIVQESVDLIVVNIVPARGYGPGDEEDVIARVKQRLGRNVRVTVNQMDTIPRTAAGKFKAVISKVKDV